MEEGDVVKFISGDRAGKFGVLGSKGELYGQPAWAVYELSGDCTRICYEKDIRPAERPRFLIFVLRLFGLR